MLDRFFPLYAFVFFLAIFLTVICEKKLIPLLKAHARQPIYLDGPSWHRTKSGTPTMGGLAFIIAITVSISVSLFIARAEIGYSQIMSVVLILTFALSNGLIGFIDDSKKLKRDKNDCGLTPKQKLFLQVLVSVLFLILRARLLNGSTAISFSFGKIELGFFYYPLALFVLLGMINSVNLTDGIDGLAASVTFAVGISLFYICTALNTEMALVSAALIGVTVGFLIFNIHPAKIFMGDTGSLFFGSLVSAIAVMLDNPILIIFIGAVYALEGLSVVLQVTSYKLFKKRIFKMSPLHHHFEKCGWSENKICIAAIIASFISSLIAYIFYLP